MRRAFSLIVLLTTVGAAAQDDVYVDHGACPGEGCRYGEVWTATGRVRLLAAPDFAADVVAIVQEGQVVETLTGEVHTVPDRFDVFRPNGDFSPGDEVLLYTYPGEGWFRLRHNGAS